VYECLESPITAPIAGRWPRIVFQKLNLFKEEFKKWKHIVFFDSDIIIRDNLDRLLEVDKFSAVLASVPTLKFWFISSLQACIEGKSDVLRDIRQKYDVTKPAFNSGMFSFPTNIIKPDMFDELCRFQDKYCSLSTYAEESALNLSFNIWNKLSDVYNLDPYRVLVAHDTAADVKGVVLHFVHDKPWKEGNLFHKEWKENLVKAEHIVDIGQAPTKPRLSDDDIKQMEDNITDRKKRTMFREPGLGFYGTIKRGVGLLGLVCKRFTPGLYRAVRARTGAR
jgi:lipopolysaccharide biosynthesis glycosyltransferase